MNVTYTAKSTVAQLIINKAEIEDEAIYKCEVTYLEVREDCDVVQIIKLTTLVIPDSVNIMKTNGEPLQNASVLQAQNEGSNIELTCQAHGGRPIPKVSWYNNTEEMKSTYQAVDEGEGTGNGIARLQVKLSRGDLKKDYKCIVESEALEEPVVTWVGANVNVKPTGIKLSGVKDDLLQGTNVKLVCDVTGAKPPAEVQWFNESISIPKNFISTELKAMPDGTTTTRSTLSFVATHYENLKTFSCSADNSVMHDQNESALQTDALMIVYYPPVVIVSPIIQTVNESSTVLLMCSYASNPMKLEEVVWSKDSKNLTLTSDKYDGGVPGNLPLVIKNVSRDDRGNYSCICRNSIGSEESEDSIYLDVQFPPTVDLQIYPSKVVKSIEKTNVTLACIVVDGNPPTFNKVQWFLGSELLKELPECNYKSYDKNGNGEGNGGPFCSIDSHVLGLVNVSEDLAGNYTCAGYNVAGWGNPSDPQELIVYYPPSPARLTATPKNVIKKGQVTLLCTVDDTGIPENLTYVWYRRNRLISEITTSNWTINPVNYETKSDYTCYASNEGGNSTSASIYVDVSAKPAFIQNLQPYQGILFTSKNISLTCRVECSPNCSLVWLLHGKEIEFNKNNLYSVKITTYPADSIKNDFESIESTLTFNMHEWPGEQLDKTAANSFYTCQSSPNGVGPGVSSKTEIAVDYPPENLTVSNSIVHVVENNKPESVTCGGKGHPTLQYTWKKESATNYSSNTNILSWRTVNRSDTGKYICEASNKHGKASTIAFLNVQFLPSCKLELEMYGGVLSLACTATANPQDVTFRFQVKGENETTIDSSQISHEGLKGYLQLDADTDRTYQCFVNNSVGTGIPCERDVTGRIAWWAQLFGDNLIIPIAVVVGIVLIIILCIIIILICRRKRGNNKYNNPLEMEEREKPDGQFSNAGKPKWPQKLAVFAHSHELRNMKINQISSLNQFKCTSVPKYDHNYKRSRNKIYYRLKDLFGLKDQDKLPLGIYRESTAVTFKKINAQEPNALKRVMAIQPPSRKRKKPGSVPNQSSLGDKGGLGAAPTSGSAADPLADPDKLFYENLPFHGMQNAPNKPISIISPIIQINRPNQLLAQPSSIMMNNSINFPVQNSMANSKVFRNQSFHGFQSDCLQDSGKYLVPNMNTLNPTARSVDSHLRFKNFSHHNLQSINFISPLYSPYDNVANSIQAQNKLSKSQYNILSPSLLNATVQNSERVVGRNESKLDIRKTASGINTYESSLNVKFRSSAKFASATSAKEPVTSLAIKKIKLCETKRFSSLNLRKHRCYSPTFLSMRCRKHAKKRSVVYAFLKTPNTPPRSAEINATQYQNLTDSIQILEQNPESESKKAPQPAPRCKKHRKREIIYQNIANVLAQNVNSLNENSIIETKVSVTEAIVHINTLNNKSIEGANGQILNRNDKSPKVISDARKDYPALNKINSKKEVMESTDNNDIRPKIPIKSPVSNVKVTPTLKVSPNFIKPSVESPKGALNTQLHAKLKNASYNASTQTSNQISNDNSLESPNNASTPCTKPTVKTPTKSNLSCEIDTPPSKMSKPTTINKSPESIPKVPIAKVKVVTKKTDAAINSKEPYRPEFSDLDYADVDYRSYGPINYKAASIYAAMKRKQDSGKLEEKDDDLL